MHKLTEAFNIASAQAENDRLKKSVKGLLRLLTSQTVTCCDLRHKVIALEQNCHLLYTIVSEPEPSRLWPWIIGAASGVLWTVAGYEIYARLF